MYLTIDTKKVLDSKKPKVDALTESFHVAKENQTPTNVINFLSLYRNTSKDTILENLSSLCDIDSDMTFSYFENVLNIAELSESTLNEYKSHIQSLMESCEEDLYKDKLTNANSKIDSVIENMNDMNNIHDEMMMNLAVSRIRKSCMFESYLADDLEVLIYNINSSPEVIYDYEQIIRKIKTDKSGMYQSSYGMLLIKNTEMIRNLQIVVTGDVLELLTSMPNVIADKIISSNMSPSVIRNFIKIYDKQIVTLYSDLKRNEPKQYILYSTYVRNLSEAKQKILDSLKTPLKENIAEMSPDIILYDEGVIEDFIAEMEDSLADIIFDPGKELNETKLENFAKLYRTYEATSKLQKGMISAGHKAGNTAQKAVSKMKSNMTDAKRATLPVKKALDPFFNLFSDTINKLKDMDKKERTERIITGNYRAKLVNFIKRGIVGIAAIGAAGAGAKVAAGIVFSPKIVGLILAAITILVGTAIDKKIDKKHRQAILVDLKNELTLVEEKIEDAKGDGARDKKYQLMRIQQKLKKDIERIEYNLD